MNKKYCRTSLHYKVTMWFFRLTWSDVKRWVDFIWSLIIGVLLFGMLLIFPHIFH